MPNADIIDGFKPFGRLYQANRYVAQSTIYKGDLVKLNAAGTVERVAAGDAIVGAALENAAAGDSCLVADHPDQQFVANVDGAAIDAQTDFGLNASVIVGTANTTYKRSAMQVDDSTLAVTSTLALRVERLAAAPDNSLGANCKVVVSINNHQRANARTGV